MTTSTTILKRAALVFAIAAIAAPGAAASLIADAHDRHGSQIQATQPAGDAVDRHVANLHRSAPDALDRFLRNARGSKPVDCHDRSGGADKVDYFLLRRSGV